MTTLPVEAVLDDLKAALRTGRNAVLVAPPGAGKTTKVAPALLDEPWCSGEIILLSPRRIAARAAAERMAALAGEPVGQTIGYATRMDVKRSAATRILVVTEGIFRNRIQAEPDLPGVSAILFDEVHERSLDSDASLAFALDAQGGLRDDLRLVAMSATLDGGRFATLVGGPVIESAGRLFPLDLRHIGRSADRIEDDMARAIRRALGEESGDVLAFLPGVAEIERTAERIAHLSGVEVHCLHGQVAPDAQRRALASSRTGARKVILATSIAETSLTIDGVRIVIDCGLARRPRYDRGAGLTRLVTERVSQAAATQRAGRAARQQNGVAYRLWEAAATSGLPAYDPPEILEADLSALMLDCAIWGVSDPRTLRWIDPPPDTAIDEAQARLRTMGAIDEAGRVTPHGRAIAALPLPPRLAHMVGTAPDKRLAAEVAMLIMERGLGGIDVDMDVRLSRWRSDRGARAEAARRAARRYRIGDERGTASVGATLARGFPDRVAKRRSADGADWVSIGGRGFRLDHASPLARADWLAIAETQGAASGARIISAAAIEEADVLATFADRVETAEQVQFDQAERLVTARRVRRIGAVTLSSAPIELDRAAMIDAVAQAIGKHGIALLSLGDRARGVLARLDYAQSALTTDAIVARAAEWLPGVMGDRRRISDIDDAALANAWLALLDWTEAQMLEQRAPAQFRSPAGTNSPIDYAAPAGPTVELRVQALFGLNVHPTIGDGVPLVLSLTSPAGRPIQTTRDLPGFWSGSWADVARDMRGRYPRHNWPDDPRAAPASLKTKNALARGR